MSSEEKGITSASGSTETFTTSVTSTYNPTSKIITLTPAKIAQPSKLFPCTSRTTLTVDETGTTVTLITLSRFSTAKSTSVQTLYSTSKFRSFSNNKYKKNDGIINGIRYIVSSTVGTLTLSLAVAVFLYRCACRKKCNKGEQLS